MVSPYQQSQVLPQYGTVSVFASRITDTPGPDNYSLKVGPAGMSEVCTSFKYIRAAVHKANREDKLKLDKEMKTTTKLIADHQYAYLTISRLSHSDHIFMLNSASPV